MAAMDDAGAVASEELDARNREGDEDDDEEGEEQGNGNEHSQSDDLQTLILAWKLEKACPEILPYEEDVVERLQEHVEQLEEAFSSFSGDSNRVLEIQLYTIEVDRVKYLLRAYLKTRLSKLDRYSMHMCSGEEFFNRLSEAEKFYAQKNVELIHKHMHECVLRKLPVQYSSLLKECETDEEIIVPTPNMDAFVFCKAKSAIGEFQLDASGEETLDLMPGEMYVIRFNAIKELVYTKQVELI